MPTISLAGLREHLLSWSAGIRFVRWLEVGLVILLAVVLADLTWELAPRPAANKDPASPSASASGPASTSGDRPEALASGAGGKGNLPQAVKGLFGTPPDSGQGGAAESEPVRETRLELTLKGIIANRGEGPRLAIIAPAQGEEKIYRPGDKVNGRAEILRIEEGRVILLRNGVTEALKLKVPEVEGRRRQADNRKGIRQTGENKRVVPEATLRENLNNLPKLLRQAKAVPATRDGQKIGFRVVNIQEGSVFEDLGVKQGDVIQQVNGRDIRSPRQAMEAYRELQGSRQFKLKVLRDGKAETLTYAVE